MIPLDHTSAQVQPGNDSVQDLMTYALKNRTEVLEVDPGAREQRT